MGLSQNNKNAWHGRVYDHELIQHSLASKGFQREAQKQIAFLCSALGLEANARVFDIPCGVGRHSLELAKRGFKVVGVDINKSCLKKARARFNHKNINYEQGNMANLRKYRNRFDALINMFTSFGHFYTDRENETALREMYRCLKSGGKLVMSLVERDALLKSYQASRWDDANHTLKAEVSRYDKNTKSVESHVMRIHHRQEPTLKHYHYHRIRLYSKNEMVGLLKKIGLRRIVVYGNFNGDSFERFVSTHPIYIGVKPH